MRRLATPIGNEFDAAALRARNPAGRIARSRVFGFYGFAFHVGSGPAGSATVEPNDEGIIESVVVTAGATSVRVEIEDVASSRTQAVTAQAGQTVVAAVPTAEGQNFVQFANIRGRPDGVSVRTMIPAP